jgi:RAB protein geranylgeranyltransferase component A
MNKRTCNMLKNVPATHNTDRQSATITIMQNKQNRTKDFFELVALQSDEQLRC